MLYKIRQYNCTEIYMDPSESRAFWATIYSNNHGMYWECEAPDINTKYIKKLTLLLVSQFCIKKSFENEL